MQSLRGPSRAPSSKAVGASWRALPVGASWRALPVGASWRALLVAASAFGLGACADGDSIQPAAGTASFSGTASNGGNGSGSGSGAGGAFAAPGWDTPPVLRNPTADSDDALARQALALMGSAVVGAEGSCRTCHSLGRPTLTRWSQLTREFTAACLDDPTLADQASLDAMLECFGGRAGESAGSLPASFGIYSAAAHLPWFSFIFEHAGELPDREAEYARFVARVGMPRAGRRLDQAEFDVVAEWFARGLPNLFELVPEDSGEACTPGLDPRLIAHVEAMQVEGWRAKNEEAPLLMFGCEAGQAGADCLADFPLARDQAEGSEWDLVPGSRILLLHDNSDSHSTYWSRASADGRFIGSGLLDPENPALSGQILDLQRGAIVEANFSYDAVFFPDNSGFLLQQGGGESSAPPGGPSDGSPDAGDVALVCEQSVLLDSPSQLTGDERECVTHDGEIGLYQQLGKALDGDDYWVIFGSYIGDDGGFEPVHANPSAAFASDSTATLTPMLNQGGRFEAGPPTQVSIPLQGDPMLSPSGRLLVTRLKGPEYTTRVDGFDVVLAEQSGYALHTLTLREDADGWSASSEDVGRICLAGGKPMLSYDERWMVLHHYVTAADAPELGFTGADDPAFEGYSELGASNLYLVDLRDGQMHRITQMSPGQYALFPHFRSDGWIYFVVRSVDGAELFAASDAALILESSAD